METLPNPKLYIESGNAKRRPVRVQAYHKTYNRRIVLRFSAGARDSYRLQKCPKEAVGSTQPSSEMILPADKTRWRDVDQLFPSSPEAMNEQTYTFTPPCTFVTCTGAIVIFFFTLIYSLLLFSLFPSSHCYFRQCQCPIWDSIKTKVNRV